MGTNLLESLTKNIWDTQQKQSSAFCKAQQKQEIFQEA